MEPTLICEFALQDGVYQTKQNLAFSVELPEAFPDGPYDVFLRFEDQHGNVDFSWEILQPNMVIKTGNLIKYKGVISKTTLEMKKQLGMKADEGAFWVVLKPSGQDEKGALSKKFSI